MANFDGSVGVQTNRNGEVVATICDPTTTTQIMAVNGDGQAQVEAEITNASLVVTATDLDIRDLAPTTDIVGIGDGTNTLSVNSDGSLNVKTTSGGTAVCDYQSTTALASDTATTHDYVITNGKVFTGTYLLVGGEAKTQVEIGTWDGATFTVLGTYFQQPAMNLPIPIPCVTDTGDGTEAIRVQITNLDNQASDVYSTLQGIEV